MPNFTILEGDCRYSLTTLQENSVHCVVCSPPYFNLRNYNLPPLLWDGAWENTWKGSLGEEDNPYKYIDHLIEVFATVRRVLRSDGILWVNIGDSYAKKDYPKLNIKYKDLFMIPALFALAMRNEGWYLRSDCIWYKCLSSTASVYVRTIM
jgi:DNA modification methylase